MVIKSNILVLLIIVGVTSSSVVCGSLKKRGVSAVAGVLLMGGSLIVPAVVGDDRADNWIAVDNNSPAHFRSVFYLLEESLENIHDGKPVNHQEGDVELVEVIGKLAEDLAGNFNIDVGQELELHRSIRNVVYIGNNEGESLFAGFLLNNKGYQKKRQRLSLYGIRGLEQEAFNYRPVAFFEDPVNHHGEVTVFAVNENFRLSALYQPVKVGQYPTNQIDRELVMVSYGTFDEDRDTELDLWQRRCAVVEGIGQEKRAVGLTNCDLAGANFRALGAPIFDAKEGSMVGFRAGASRDIWYAEGALTEFITYVRRLQATMTKVNPVDKMTTVWGKIKSLEFSD